MDLIITILLWIAKFVVFFTLAGLTCGTINASRPRLVGKADTFKILLYVAVFIVAAVVFTGGWLFILLLGVASGIVSGLFENAVHRKSDEIWREMMKMGEDLDEDFFNINEDLESEDDFYFDMMKYEANRADFDFDDDEPY